MKYSKDIESLIDSVIAKGVITEQDRNSIVRKAVIQGLDPEEFNRELDTRLRSVAIPKEPSPHLTTSSEDNNHSMFSKELESLIHATLEDGVLEEYEKAALIKRAQNEGVDLAELEIYINSILQRRQRELNNEKQKLAEAYKKEKKEAFGRVCPNCGKQVPPLAIKCDCGYEFNKGEGNSTMGVLCKKIAEIEKWEEGKHESTDAFHKRKLQAKIDAINMMPIPNTKEDIIEFLSMSIPNSKKKGGLWGTKSGRFVVLVIVGVIAAIVFIIFNTFMGPIFKGGGIFDIIGMCLMLPIIFGGVIVKDLENPTFEHNNMVDTWRMKFEQVMLKGRSLQGDSDFQRQLDYYENQLNN